MSLTTIIVISVLLILIFSSLLASIKIVPQGYNWTVERFGRYTNTLPSGLHFIAPFIDVIGHKVCMMEQVINIPPQGIISKDNASVDIDAICFIQVVDAKKASYEISALNLAVESLVQTSTRSQLGSLELDEMLTKRDEINNKLLLSLDATTSAWGIKVTRVELKDITPPKELVNAMNSVLRAEREKRASVLEAEGFKAAEILKADGQKQGDILRAEADKQSDILKAEGMKQAAILEAEARERTAEAEAKATELVSNSIAAGDINAINYFIAQEYTKALQAIGSSDNSKVVMLPLDATSLMGSLGGISEMFKGLTKSKGE